MPKNALRENNVMVNTSDNPTVRQQGRKIGICGQAPSDYPEFARFSVA
jgi:phosphoenolpyruvate synthase/pyruvate phosphate dikinase